MLSSRETETVVLINTDTTIKQDKDKSKDKPDEFGKIHNRIELVLVYAWVIFIFFIAFKKMKLLSDDVLSSFSTSALKEGWLFDRKMDLSDFQWRTYRENVSIYLLFAISFTIAFKVIKYTIWWYYKHQLLLNHSKQINHDILSKIASIYNLFYVMIGIIFILYLHGISCVVMLLFMLMNYGIAKLSYTTKYCILITWIYNVFIAFVSFHFEKELSSNWLLDLMSFKTISHWNQSYRFCILRCISFNMDLYYISIKQNIYKSQYNDTQYIHIHDFSIINYFAYLLYVPLELMGPIISFHEWLIQIKLKFVRPFGIDKLNIDRNENENELSYRNLAIYLFRCIIVYILHEIMLHYLYMHYISRFGYPKEIQKRSDYLIVLALVSYFHLKLIWLKFSVMWKIARLWALCDDVVTVENMQRCISNTTSIIGFWKYWHSSFNVWNIRYLYIPLGGNKKNRILNILIVFLFVFLWHGDFHLSLLFWSLLMFIGIIPEIFVKRFCFKNNKIKNNRYILAAGSAINAIVLIIANNIGFGGGLDRMLYVLREFFLHNPWNGVPTFLFLYFCVSTIVIVTYHARYLKSQITSN